MRILFNLILLLLIINSVNAQESLFHSLSSGANEGKNSGISMTYNFGQVMTGTFTEKGKNYFLSQGFLQSGSIIISSVFERDVKLSSGINIYPNPVKNYININLQESSSFKLQIVDLYGKIVYDNYLEWQVNQVDLSFLSRGGYLLYLYDDENVNVCMYKIIKL
ncbi:T9SS type A sorting domain-containing protein [Bacteroidota bacterium]